MKICLTSVPTLAAACIALIASATALRSAAGQISGPATRPGKPTSFSVDAFGAKGDGAADDTAAIQSAVDAAHAAGGGRVVFRGGATYLVKSVDLSPGILLEGNGATVRRPDKTPGKFTRTFTTGNHPWSSDQDSPPLVIRDLTLDGNRLNQGPYDKYEIEQAHLLFLMGGEGAGAKKGRLRALVEGCTFKDSPADGLSVYTNASVQVSNCTAVDCFRGGITVTGGYSVLQVNNFVGKGDAHPSGLHWEVDGKGFGDSLATETVIHGATLLDGHFAALLGPGSHFLATGVICRRPTFNVYAPGSTVRISDSLFTVGVMDGYVNRVVHPGDVTFSHCQFTLSGPADATAADKTATDKTKGQADRKFAGVDVQWNVNGTAYKGLRLRLLDCTFAADSTIGPRDTTYAVFTTPDVSSNDNRLTVEGGEVSAAYRYGLYLSQGGRCSLRGTRIAADTGVFVGSPGGFETELELDGATTRGATSLHWSNPNLRSILTCRNMEDDESRSALATDYGLDVTCRGGRVIDVDSPPVGRIAGLRGDRARLKSPRPGETYEWVCTATGLPAKAEWKAVSKLAE